MRKIFLLMLLVISSLYGKWQNYGFNYNYEIGIMTGGIGGTYIKFGRDIARLMDETNSKILLRPIISRGSQINIVSLKESPGVDLAIVQSDVMQVYKESGRLSKVLKELRYITYLYNEEIHIVTLKNSSLKYVKDLENKKVMIGPKGSGTELTSKNIFGILNMDVTKLNLPYDVAFKKLFNHQISAIILVGGKPLSRLKPYLTQIKFLEFSDNSIALLKSTYLKSKLTHNDYSNITTPITTIAVPSILVAYNWTPRNNAYRYNGLKRFVNVFFSNLEQFKEIGESYGNHNWESIEPFKKVPGWKRSMAVRAYFNNN